MAPLACDPTALDGAGATLVATGESLGSVISALTTALAGSSGMAGDDPVGATVGRAYNGAAAKVIEAMTSTRNGLCSIGDGVRMSAHNYAFAEAMSDVTGRAEGLPTPPVTGPLTVGASPPSAVGAGSDTPAGWSWVAPYIGMIWPTGDSAKLRAAAAAWTTAGVNFMTTEIAAGGGTMAAIAAQQIPEAAAINKALAYASGATSSVAQQCQTIAAQLNSYARRSIRSTRRSWICCPAPGDGNPHGPPDSDPKDPTGHGPSPDDGSDHHLPLHPLNSDDLAALAHYTGPGYQDLNFALREGALDASQQARVDALHQALEELPTYEGAVVRGTNLPADVLDQYRPGEIITESAFTSTSVDHTVAQSPTFAGNTEFRIWSTTGRDVSSVSMYPGEQEILFPAGSKFYVINKTVDPQTGRTIIEMIER